jgi:hydrogenase maturation protein HypF
LSVLRAAFPDRWRSLDLPVLRRVDPKKRELVSRQLEMGLNAPATSSLGRLFDAVACLTDICTWNEREGQAAIGLQSAAADGGHPAYPFGMLAEAEPVRIDWRPMIREIVGDVQAGVDVSIISARFHETVVAMFASAAKLAMSAAGGSGADRVVLSGGCFLNDRLRAGLTSRLGDHGATVATHRRVATGDGGLSLGQAVIGSAVAAGESPKAK